MHVHVQVVTYMYVLTCTSVALLHEPSEAFMAHSTTNTLNDRIWCEVVTQKLICVRVCALTFGLISHAVISAYFFDVKIIYSAIQYSTREGYVYIYKL